LLSIVLVTSTVDNFPEKPICQQQSFTVSISFRPGFMPVTSN
jgi:hypothetical protein